MKTDNRSSEWDKNIDKVYYCTEILSNFYQSPIGSTLGNGKIDKNEIESKETTETIKTRRLVNKVRGRSIPGYTVS